MPFLILRFYTIFIFGMISEWNMEDDSLLYQSRLALLTTPPNGLKLRTEGYTWYRLHNNKPNRILKVAPRGKYTVSEDPQFLLGKVENLWRVASSSSIKSDQSLKNLCKIRLAQRKNPIVNNYEEYIKIRKSCWIIEERIIDGSSDFFCDCAVSMKTF